MEGEEAAKRRQQVSVSFIICELELIIPRPIQVDLPISAPGAFCYFFEHDSAVAGEPRIQTRKGYFNVDPLISLPSRTPFFPEQSYAPTGKSLLEDTTSGAVLGSSENYPLDAMSIISIIPKWQGQLSNWEPYLAEASRRGYNMIHYCPLQTRGQSGSPYSIYDQLVFDKTLLENGVAPEDGGVEQINNILALAKSKFGLGSVTDVVLNHTADNSAWLHDHPEAGQSAAVV